MLGGGLLLVGGAQWGDQLQVVELVVRGQALERGGDEFAGRGGVAAERVCSRASQHSRWSRCRASTHQTRRVMNRRECGTAATTAAKPSRMTPAQVRVVQVSSRQNAAARAVRMVSSVRHRQAMPAGVRWNLTNSSSSW